MNKIVHILRGIPGCGKSEVAHNLHKMTTCNGNTAMICCADDFFTDLEGNYNWNLEQLPTAHLWCLQEFKNALFEGINNIIVSNTNIASSDVNKYRELAVEAGYMVFVLTVENWHNGKDVHNVPVETKLAMNEILRQNLKGFDMPKVEVNGVMVPAYKRNKDTGHFELVDYTKAEVKKVKHKFTEEEINVLRQISKSKNK